MYMDQIECVKLPIEKIFLIQITRGFGHNQIDR